jgi:stalled ribosome alternative rescue factor ArfA
MLRAQRERQEQRERVNVEYERKRAHELRARFERVLDNCEQRGL